MSLYRRTQRELCEEAEAERDREYPMCSTCEQPKGWPGGCEGHEEEAPYEPPRRLADLVDELRATLAGEVAS